VAESKSGSKLMGRVMVLAKFVVALEIVKFEISDALNLIVVPQLEFVTPVIFMTLSSGAEGIVPSRKLMFNKLLKANALLSKAPNIAVVVAWRLIYLDRADVKIIIVCCNFE
jgi:hypothetical protein